MAADCGVFFGEVEGGSGGVEGEEVEAGLVEGADEEVHCFFFAFFSSFSFAFFLLGNGWEEVVVVVWKGFQVVLSFFFLYDKNRMVRGERWSRILPLLYIRYVYKQNTSSSEEEQGVIIAI